MKRKVVIDATPLLYRQDGIGRMTNALVKSILSVENPFEITLFGRRLMGRHLKTLGLNAKTVHMRCPRAGERFLCKTNLIERLCAADLYHATDFYLPIKNPAKAIATIHDLIFMIQPENMVDHIRLKRRVPDFLKQCRRIIAVSDFSKKDIVNLFDIDPDRIHVVYNAVDHQLFYPVQDQTELRRRLTALLNFDRPYFLAVSCSTGRKNTPFLLKTYDAFSKNAPTHDLVLAWNPPEEIKHAYDSNRYGNRIHFIGRQSDKDLADLYRGATALVFPSLYEGFGFPVVEAMSCGTPVICSQTSSMPEIGGDAAIYMDPYNENSLISVMEAFENQEIDIELLRKKCIAQSQKFSFERLAAETLSVYERFFEENLN